jgi:hypothetical protein
MLYVKNSALVKGLNDMSQRLKGVGSSIMSIGGALSGLGASIVGPLVGAVAQFASMGSELADMSARTGLAAGNLAELKFAAEQSGAGIEEVEKAILKMQKNGVTGTFDEVAARIASIEDPAQRTQAALETWGKSGAKLLPMIDNLQKLRQEARDLGLVPTEEAVSMADAIGDAWDAVHSVMKATVFNIGAALAPVLLPALETVKGIAVWFNRWSQQNTAIIRSVFMIGAGLGVTGAVVAAMGAAIFGLGAVFGAAATVLTTIGAVVGTILSPIGLIVSAIVGGVVAWVRFTDSGKQAVASIKAFFLPLIETLKTTVGSIGDALQAGNLELAAQIAVTGLKVVFLQALDQISQAIGGTLGAALGDIGTRVIQGDLQGAWQTAVAGMGQLWADFSLGIVNLMVSAMKGVMDLWQKTVSGIANGLLKMSAEGGVLGKIANLFVGADVAKIKAENDRLDRERMAKGMGGPQDIFSIGSGSINDSTSALRGPVDEFMRGLGAAARDAAQDADARLGSRAGTPRVNEELQRERENLERLRREAEQAAAAAKRKKADGSDLGPVAAELKSAATVTGFSGFALGLAGQGGGVQEIARTAAQQLKEARESKRLLAKIADKEQVLAE